MNNAVVSPGTAVSGFKRLLGTRHIVKREAELVPYKFTVQLGPRCGIEMETKEGSVKRFLPEHPAGILIPELKRIAEAFLGHDIRVVDYFVDLIKEKHCVDIRRDESALRKLRAECKRSKKALSDREDTLVSIGSVLKEGMSIDDPLTRANFEELNRDLIARALDMVDMVVLEGAPASQLQSRKDAIDEIILVGGTVRIPMVTKLLEHYFRGRGLIRDEAVICCSSVPSRVCQIREECQNGGVSGPLWLAR
ncbi:hypothetical protein ACQ4PT_010175 [Festuca glaucescens]